ncbi:hypothetical protein OHB26_27180 [Nocardia sp. NBC_01503]|nr:hypothetical protein [Nocardia sp. NBC_01503]WTL30595.1 hypothetical protein OHB26_27180 [Nocardia sp. NBC_01503]
MYAHSRSRRNDRLRRTAVWGIIGLLVAILMTRPIAQVLVALGVTIGWH